MTNRIADIVGRWTTLCLTGTQAFQEAADEPGV